jgi:hypothetical protein
LVVWDFLVLTVFGFLVEHTAASAEDFSVSIADELLSVCSPDPAFAAAEVGSEVWFEVCSPVPVAWFAA